MGDQSAGDPTSRAWQLISEGGIPSQMGSNPDFTHEFTSSGTYTIKLMVENQWGEDQIEQTIEIEQGTIFFAPLRVEPLFPLFSGTPTPDYSTRFVFQNITNLHPGTPFQTTIPTNQYNCSVNSLAALHGDIEEHDIGNVIRVWLSNGGPYWTIEANFRTRRHGDGGQEKWSIGLLCADKNNSKFFSDIYLKPKVNNTVSLNPSYYEIPGDYTCTIAGYDVKNVNIEDDSAGDIIQVFTRKDNDGEWQVTADFLDEGGDESWIVQMMCFYDNQSVILDYDDAVIKNIPPFSSDSGAYQTSINSSEYACGIAGMHALSGNVNENNIGDIFRVYTYQKNGKWHIFADFRTHGQNEMWDIDLMCIHQSVVSINMNQWPENWINR